MPHLDPDHWHDVQPWLDLALELPPGVPRADLLVALRAVAPGIADTLEELLRGEDAPHSLTVLGDTLAELIEIFPRPRTSDSGSPCAATAADAESNAESAEALPPMPRAEPSARTDGP